MNSFNFRPVGQGLFYTGSLLNGCYNFVYDCGTENNQNLIDKQIKCYQQEIACFSNSKSTLDFVVISHLHKDHYSGLYKLVRNFKVKRIYLPYLNCFTKDALQLHLYYDLFIDNAQSGNQQENLMALYILINSLYGLNENNSYRENIGEVEYVRRTTAIDYIDKDNIYWQFKFIYNKIDDDKVNEINDKCRALLNNANCVSMKEFIEQNKYNISLISQAYRKVFGHGNALNNTSVLLLHFPVEERNYLSYCNYNNFEYRRMKYFKHRIRCGGISVRPSNGVTLLTGDMKFNHEIAKELKRNMRDNTLSVLQVPHHGALANWTALSKYSFNSEIYIIPFGYGNIYGHPAIKVVDDLLAKNHEFHCVTQNQGFVYYID